MDQYVVAAGVAVVLLAVLLYRRSEGMTDEQWARREETSRINTIANGRVWDGSPEASARRRENQTRQQNAIADVRARREKRRQEEEAVRRSEESVLAAS
jgi:hypothetical protein